MARSGLYHSRLAISSPDVFLVVYKTITVNSCCCRDCVKERKTHTALEFIALVAAVILTVAHEPVVYTLAA